MTSLSSPSSPSTHPLGEPPAPTWNTTIQILYQQIKNYNHPDIKITGITTALAATLTGNQLSLPSPFLPKTTKAIENELLGVQVELSGKLNTPLEGGTWIMEIYFPIEFPWKPPTYHLITPHFHADVLRPERIETNFTKEQDEQLYIQLLEAKELLAPPSNSTITMPLTTPSLTHLSTPNISVLFKHIDQSQHVIQISTQDSLAGLKLRYASVTGWLFENEKLTCNGIDLVDATTLQDNDVVYLIRELYDGPCGPFATQEHSTTCMCRKNQKFTPQSSINWLTGVEDYRNRMHVSVQILREEMMISAGLKQYEMKEWNPWVGIWNRSKVRNIKAAVLLAQGKMEEYNKCVVRFTKLYATVSREEPKAPAVVEDVPPPPPTSVQKKEARGKKRKES